MPLPDCLSRTAGVSRLATAFGPAVVALALSACSSTPLGPEGAAVSPPAAVAVEAGAAVASPLASSADAAAAPAYVYRVAPGDELSFRFFYTPSLNTTATVRADGRLALPLAGDIAVAGLSMAELSSRVEAALSPTVRRPQVTVNVQGTGSQRVFVGGEVGKPGVQPLLGPLTVLQALIVAEGLKDSAQPRKALVMRRGAQGERLVLAVDLSAALSGRDPSQDLALQPLDVLIVPRSGISDLNVWVDQYIRRMLPVSVGFSYAVNRNGVVQ